MTPIIESVIESGIEPVVKKRKTPAPRASLIAAVEQQGEKARTHALLLAQAMNSCAVAPRTMAAVLQSTVGEVEGYVLGGMTTLSDELVLRAVTMLFELKRAKLDGLRGQDQSSVLALIWSLLPE